MATSKRGSGVVGYNVQVAVDIEHHLIVTHEVTNVGFDRSQLAHIAKEAKGTLQTDTLEAVADRGYVSGEESRGRLSGLRLRRLHGLQRAGRCEGMRYLNGVYTVLDHFREQCDNLLFVVGELVGVELLLDRRVLRRFLLVGVRNPFDHRPVRQPIGPSLLRDIRQRCDAEPPFFGPVSEMGPRRKMTKSAGEADRWRPRIG
jgi:hypothetical protein